MRRFALGLVGLALAACTADPPENGVRTMTVGGQNAVPQEQGNSSGSMGTASTGATGASSSAPNEEGGCEPNEELYYTEIGCDVEPVCLAGTNDCLQYACSCEGRTIGGCGAFSAPIAHMGNCGDAAVPDHCCPLSPEPDCCMDYGGSNVNGCGTACDGMPWPSAAWEVRIDEDGCPYWHEPEPRNEFDCCGCAQPNDGGSVLSGSFDGGL
jgi:hypothetical protein